MPKVVRRFLDELSLVSRRKLARGLISRADVARDGNHFAVAAALYKEALDLGWADPNIYVQRGNMLKDSGQFREAEQQYLLAMQHLPGDPDIPLQIAHLYKVAGDTPQAEAYYRRALELRPGWDVAQRELTAMASHESAPPPIAGLSDDIVMELLPSGPAAKSDQKRFHLFQLGRQAKGRKSDRKLLRGVEAIRGYCLSSTPLEEIQLFVGNDCVRCERLVAYPIEKSADTKYVFNLWHDFSGIALGDHVIELRMLDSAGKVVQRHRQRLEIAPPLEEDMAATSDAWVPAPAVPPASLEEAIRAMPSVTRTTQRHLLPPDIRTILVQRVDQLGDLACSVPAIQRLRALFPHARLVGLLSPANVGLAEALGLFDEVAVIDFAEDLATGRRCLDVEAQNKLRRDLKEHAFDLAIDLGEGGDSRPLLLLSGARFLYGFHSRHFSFLHAGLDFGAHDPVNTNEVLPPSRKFMLLVEGLAALKGEVAVSIPHHDRTALADVDLAVGERYALIHTGARLFFSRWPGFETLTRMILERTDLKLVILGETEAFGDDLPPSLRERLLVLSGMLPFARMDALVSNAALFIGNDSGPKHLAALRGVPVVSIHIPRNNWSEWAQEISGLVITRRVPCAGCGIAPDGTDCGKGFPCIRGVTPEEVFTAASRAMAATI